MALSANDITTVLGLRDHYFKAVDAEGVEAASWPVDDAGNPYRSDATTPADTDGTDAARGTVLDSGYKSKIGSQAQKVQDDMNEMLDLLVTLGGA